MLLQHTISYDGTPIELQPDGMMSVETFVSYRLAYALFDWERPINVQDIERMLNENNTEAKIRFRVRRDDQGRLTHIGACQGHSG